MAAWGGPGIRWSSEASRLLSRTVLSVTTPFHSADSVPLASLPPSPYDQLSARWLASARVWACRFRSVHSQSGPRPCQDHRAPGRHFTAPVVSTEPTAALLRQWDRYLLVPSAPSSLTVHLSSRPPPSFPKGFRGTRTRHAWMPRTGSSLCGAPTTAIRSRAMATPAPSAPTWNPPAPPGSRAQLLIEFL